MGDYVQWISLEGRGELPPDARAAARLFKLAADQESAAAQFNLANFYLRGRGGLPKDEREAARLYQLAADQGDPDAQANLGVFYQRGLGGPAKDDREAARLFQLAANHAMKPRSVTWRGLAIDKSGLGR